MVIGFTLLVLGTFLLHQAISERTQLLGMKEAQEKPLQQADQVKKQVDNLSSDIAKLALGDHAGAKQLIGELERSGIRVAP